MRNSLDEGTMVNIRKTLSERFGEPIIAPENKETKATVCEQCGSMQGTLTEGLCCEHCGSMFTVD